MPTKSFAPGSSAFWLILIAIAIGLLLCYSGVFYRTGAQFYQSCWQKRHADGKEPNSPEQAAQWAACEDIADAALFNAGFVYSGNPQYAVTPQLNDMIAACPSNYRDIPVAGSWVIAVKMIEQSGGPTLSDRFLPASSTIVRVFKTKWPNCAATAAANGFPKLVKRNGGWDFEGPCAPCRAEDQAIEKAKQEQRRWDSLPEAEKQQELDKIFDEARAAARAAGQNPEAGTKK